ncbi:MAG: ABC transporter permease [Nitrospinota bacterium]|nr:ABC transporter permease [Nitrospinota bacterium]
MKTYIIRRTLQSLIVFCAILVIIFSMLWLTGNPAEILLPVDADQEAIDELSKEMGFDQPLYIQFGYYLFGNPHQGTGGLIRGDFGISSNHEIDALELVLQHFPNTITLAVCAVCIAVILSIPLGVLSATFRNTWIDYSSSVCAMFGQSMPNFWFGLLLILFFAVWWKVLPTSGYENWTYLILPSATAGIYATARITRMVRSQMLDVLEMDYVRTARSKGLVEWVVVILHALKNASIPIVTLIGLELGILLGGTVVTETIFSFPGVGYLVVDAIATQDFPVVQAAVALLSFSFVFVNLFVDILYAWLDPRITYS